jgi:GxxExxY protein
MSTDRIPDLHAGESEKLLFKEETHQILGCAFEVLNHLGPGLHEKAYENALVVEFKLRGIPFDQQRRFDVLFKEQQVAVYVPDLLVFGTIIVDTKTIPKIGQVEEAKMLNYLSHTKLRLGLILNFYHPRLEWSRKVR